MDCKADSPKLDLKLNLSPPGPHPQVESPDRSVSSMQLSPRGSCVSSESSYETLRSPSSPEATSMMLVGCPRCLMLVAEKILVVVSSTTHVVN
ncbi:hypothetical protein RJ639_015849 [Escallonia herrerae]|uniref:GIR1-like zinc ribbon domain-containing protein n=1 Tax=Escallonia herrerae TaxID=1293975 RepID=A0AA88VDD2_9ASTE|nr:hypothetical protein RJ639_015849 [Escallonia herrerae]